MSTAFFVIAGAVFVGFIAYNYVWPVLKSKQVSPPPRPGDNV